MANYAKTAIKKEGKAVNNYIILSGNLCRDFQKVGTSGQKNTLAVYQGADKDTMFIEIISFENIDLSHLKKGEAVQILGKLRASTYNEKVKFSVVFEKISELFEPNDIIK